MRETLISTAKRFFHVVEINGANYLARTTLKSLHGPMYVSAVFHDEHKADPNEGRFFFDSSVAKKLFDVAQFDISQYDNPLINGMTLEQMHEWADNLSPSAYQRIVNPYLYDRGVVYLEYAGTQIVAERRSFKFLKLLNKDEELPIYEGNYDDYFCIRVDLTEDHDEDRLAFLYVKDKGSLVAVMDKLLDTWIDVQVMVSSVERLKALMGISVDQD